MDINSASVTASTDDARNGLIKAMIYLEAQPKVQDNYVRMLRTVLDYINKLVDEEYKLTHTNENNDKEQHTNIVSSIEGNMIYQSDYDELGALGMGDVATVFEEEVATGDTEVDESIELTLSKHEDISMELMTTCDATRTLKYTGDTQIGHTTYSSNEFNVKVEPCTNIIDAFNSHIGTHKTVEAADVDLAPSDGCKPDIDVAPSNTYTSDEGTFNDAHDTDFDEVSTAARDGMTNASGDGESTAPGESQNDKNDIESLSRCGSNKKCHICGVVLRRPSVLKLHLQLHSVERPFECDKCLKRFWTLRTLNTHMHTHSKVTTLQCSTEGSETSSRSVNAVKNECHVCGMVYRSPSALKRHLLAHSSERPFSCDICNTKFKTLDALNRHVRTHDAVKRFECTTCGQRFFNHSYLKFHEARHRGEVSFKCIACDKGFLTATQLKVHMSVHSDDKPHMCNSCDLGFKQKRSLVNHMIKAHGKRDVRKVAIRHSSIKRDGTSFDLNPIPCRCKLCGTYLQNVKYLKKHMKMHSVPRSFHCSKCDKSFKWKSHLSSHEKMHTGVKSHVCKDCGKKFARLTGLRFHSSIHQKEHIRPSFLCSKCGKCFSSRGYLTMHLNKHKEKPYYCEKCNRYLSVFDMSHHMRMHSGERGHECFTCRKYFTTMHDLKKHCTSHHHTDTFTCQLCDSSFMDASCLNEHMNIHSPQNNVDQEQCKQDTLLPTENEKPSSNDQKKKPFCCDECGKTFTGARTLKLHQKQHSGNMPYRCSVCNKGCHTPSELKLHMTAHTGERPYSCDMCDKRFRSAADKKRHMRTHTDAKPYSCRTCGQCFGRPDALKKHSICHESLS